MQILKSKYTEIIKQRNSKYFAKQHIISNLQTQGLVNLVKPQNTGMVKLQGIPYLCGLDLTCRARVPLFTRVYLHISIKEGKIPRGDGGEKTCHPFSQCGIYRATGFVRNPLLELNNYRN